jgi:hypothetical protein
MAIRRLNYTARQRIHRGDTLITLYSEESEPSYFDVELRLDDYKLPAGAPVVIEAYRQTTMMRFACGTAGSWAKPENPVLADFSPNDRVLFRVKVMENGVPRGRILAEGDRIPVVAPGEKAGSRIPLLVVEPADLGHLAWRLDFGHDDEPRLLVTKKVVDWRALARSPDFMLLVYPTVLEQVLTKVLLIDEFSDLDDLSDWRARWLRFAAAVNRGGDMPDENDTYSVCASWIKDTVNAFGKTQRLMARFGGQVLGGVSE